MKRETVLSTAPNDTQHTQSTACSVCYSYCCTYCFKYNHFNPSARIITACVARCYSYCCTYCLYNHFNPSARNIAACVARKPYPCKIQITPTELLNTTVLVFNMNSAGCCWVQNRNGLKWKTIHPTVHRHTYKLYLIPLLRPAWSNCISRLYWVTFVTVRMWN